MRKFVLVAKDPRRGYHVPLETLMYLSGLPPSLKVSCVTISGKAKSGKSYLLNRLFLNNSKIKFTVNSSIEKGTTGLEAIFLRS
jgi:hypothetical protein